MGQGVIDKVSFVMVITNKCSCYYELLPNLEDKALLRLLATNKRSDLSCDNSDDNRNNDVTSVEVMGAGAYVDKVEEVEIVHNNSQATINTFLFPKHSQIPTILELLRNCQSLQLSEKQQT